LVSGCAFIPPFMYQISRQLDNAFVFITTFTLLRKEEKNEETKPIFKGSYLRNARCDLVAIWNVWWRHWPAFPLKKFFCFVKVSRSYVYVKIAFLFFLLITHWCGMLAFWAARHTLDMAPSYINLRHRDAIEEARCNLISLVVETGLHLLFSQFLITI